MCKRVRKSSSPDFCRSANIGPPPQASSAEQSRPSHVGQTSAPPSVSNGTLTLSETSTQMEARKPTTNGSVPTSAFPGGGADATPKPMDSSVQAEQPSADSSGESTKYIKNDLVPFPASSQVQNHSYRSVSPFSNGSAHSIQYCTFTSEAISF